MDQRLVTVGIVGHWGENPNKKSEFYSVNCLVCFFLGLEQRNKYDLTTLNYFYFPSFPTSFCVRVRVHAVCNNTVSTGKILCM